MGFMSLAGNLVGALIGFLAPLDDTFVSKTNMYWTIVVILAATTLITVTQTPEASSLSLKSSLEPIHWKPFLKEMVAPFFRNRDYRLVLVSRFLYQLGIATVTQFIQYWIGDCISSPYPAAQSASLVLIPLLVLSPIGMSFFFPLSSALMIILFNFI
jgi:Na+/melibiose symporter-like transporter